MNDWKVASVGQNQLSYPSVGATTVAGLFLNVQQFGSDRFPEGDVQSWQYYPLTSGLILKGSAANALSGDTFTNIVCLDTKTNLLRWGDYTLLVFQPPLDGPTWLQDFYTIHEFTKDGL